MNVIHYSIIFIFIFISISIAFAALTLISTLITKIIPTSANHMVTTFTFLNPEIALLALFKLLSSYKVQKLIIFLVFNSIFITWHTFMEYGSTIEAVVLVTLWTVNFIVTVRKYKHILTICCWTPWHVLLGVCMIFECSLIV